VDVGHISQRTSASISVSKSPLYPGSQHEAQTPSLSLFTCVSLPWKDSAFGEVGTVRLPGAEQAHRSSFPRLRSMCMAWALAMAWMGLSCLFFIRLRDLVAMILYVGCPVGGILWRLSVTIEREGYFVIDGRSADMEMRICERTLLRGADCIIAREKQIMCTVRVALVSMCSLHRMRNS
jgi:hypothetical protein